MTLLVTGGAGFIGSNFIIDWLQNHDEKIINLDKLTYAGNIENLAHLKENERHLFFQGDVANRTLLENLLTTHTPRAIIHMAAESHVDRSIHNPEDFIHTNIIGTFNLLEAARGYWTKLTKSAQERFCFLQISTDEVYGSLELDESGFSETRRYAPSSPYSASKASADHLARSYYHTYRLPVIITHCSNNYGPYQFPEKLIPLTIHHALDNKPLPIYGNGEQIRDWLYVKDHCRAIQTLLDKGVSGEVYNIGGSCEKTNLETVQTLCDILDEFRPRSDRQSYREQIIFVKDRPGHDRRYAINHTKIKQTFGWEPKETFSTGLHKTINWYLEHPHWVANIANGEYRHWIERQYT